MSLFNQMAEALKPEIIEHENSEIARLEKEVIKLNEVQESMKTVNAIIRKAKGADCTKEIFDYWQSKGWTKLTEEKAKEIQVPDFCGRIGFPSYKLTNNNAVIKNKLQRIKELTARDKAATQDTKEFPFTGGKAIMNFEAERVQLFFKEKPKQEIINTLKRSYNWSPSNMCWQRKLTNNAIWDTNNLFNTKIPSML